jgi:hypothetical protein
MNDRGIAGQGTISAARPDFSFLLPAAVVEWN